MSISDLEKELAFELVKSTPSIFSKDEAEEGYVPIDVPLTGIEAIITKYKK